MHAFIHFFISRSVGVPSCSLQSQIEMKILNRLIKTLANCPLHRVLRIVKVSCQISLAEPKGDCTHKLTNRIYLFFFCLFAQGNLQILPETQLISSTWILPEYGDLDIVRKVSSPSVITKNIISFYSRPPYGNNKLNFSYGNFSFTCSKH